MPPMMTVAGGNGCAMTHRHTCRSNTSDTDSPVPISGSRHAAPRPLQISVFPAVTPATVTPSGSEASIDCGVDESPPVFCTVSASWPPPPAISGSAIVSGDSCRSAGVTTVRARLRWRPPASVMVIGNGPANSLLGMTIDTSMLVPVQVMVLPPVGGTQLAEPPKVPLASPEVRVMAPGSVTPLTVPTVMVREFAVPATSGAFVFRVSEAMGEAADIGIGCALTVPTWIVTEPLENGGLRAEGDRDDEAGVTGDLGQLAGAGLGIARRTRDRCQLKGRAAQGRPAGRDVDSGDRHSGRHGDRQRLDGGALITGIGNRHRHHAGAARRQAGGGKRRDHDGER